MKPHLLLCALLTLAASVAGQVSASAHSAPNIPEQVSNPAWEADIRRFEASDAAQPPPAHALLFVGSSSIRLWHTLAADFPGQAVINRGFGGSELRDSTWYADRIVIRYAPRLIVLYAGDNDLAAGRTPAQLRDDFIAFVQRIRRDLPDTPIAYLSIKPSPSRQHLAASVVEANQLIQQVASRLLHVQFIDIHRPMLDAVGQPRAELFQADRLHMNAAGYRLWRDALAPAVARAVNPSAH